MKPARKLPLRKLFISTNNYTAMKPFRRNIESKKTGKLLFDSLSASSKAHYSFTITGVPAAAASKKRRAMSSGRRMHPCEAA